MFFHRRASCLDGSTERFRRYFYDRLGLSRFMRVRMIFAWRNSSPASAGFAWALKGIQMNKKTRGSRWCSATMGHLNGTPVGFKIYEERFGQKGTRTKHSRFTHPSRNQGYRRSRLLVGGFPCQDYSVAELFRGTRHQRREGNLGGHQANSTSKRPRPKMVFWKTSPLSTPLQAPGSILPSFSTII